MPRSRPPYPAEFRRKIVELARTGRTPGDLRAVRTSPSRLSATGWRRPTAPRQAAAGKDGLTSAEREEFTRLRRREPAAQAGARHPGKPTSRRAASLWAETPEAYTPRRPDPRPLAFWRLTTP